jgi:outer membrane protein
MSDAGARPRGVNAGAVLHALVAIAVALTPALAPAALAQQASTPPPLGLREALVLASDGPDVRVARTQLEAALLAAAAAGAAVTGSARTGYTVQWHDGARGEAGGFQPLSVTATLDVLPYGPRGEALERAAAAVADAERARSRATASAIITAAERWWAAVRAEEGAQLAAHRLELAERSLAAVRVQAEAGTAGPGAVAEAELALSQAALDQAAATVDVLAARAALAQHLGTDAFVLAAREEEVRTAAGRLTVDIVLDAEAVARGVAESERVRSALRALRDAELADARARREAGPSVAASASVGAAGASGRVSLGASWDSRSFQPTVDLSIEPYRPSPPSTTAAVGVSVTVPFSTTRGPEREQGLRAIAMAEEQLAQARTIGELELQAQLRGVEAVLGQLALALERARLRDDHAISRALGAELGHLAPLDLERGALDDRAAEINLGEILDTARLALARLELALGGDPIPVLVGTAAAAAGTEHAPAASAGVPNPEVP